MRLYCHFSFRRRNNNAYGLFACAFYTDYNGRKCVGHLTRKYDLWEPEDGYVTAIQGYEHALRTISEAQVLFKKRGVTEVMLVTDNSALAGWIVEPNKKKKFAPYMERAVEKYRVGGKQAITLKVGLCEVWDVEKSYKYCNERFIVDIDEDKSVTGADGVRRLDLGVTPTMSLEDYDKESINAPKISGMQML